MAKSKTPTPQELYRLRKQREERERTAYLPPGLINHGNTCFMNSVLQGLIATRLLSDLVHFNPIPAEIQQTAVTPILSRRSPQLTNGHNLAGKYEQLWVNTMPIGDMFLTVLYKSWEAQAARKRESISPKSILGALGQKYDQYLDFAQQDAHEFLRILLDAMRMEEQDVIKKRQPPPPKKRRRATLTPANVSRTEPVASSSSQPNDHSPDAAPSEDDIPLSSFADMLFGGQLTSILVCQKCKHVSQTYEEFNDISLSIKPEDYLHNRKRDRFKKIVGKLTAFPGASGSMKEKDKEKDKEKGKEKEKDKDKETLGEKERPRLPIAPAHAMEIQRSSSVPPSPKTELDPTQLEVLPLVDSTRRRSLDAVGSVTSLPVPAVELDDEALGQEKNSSDVAAAEEDPKEKEKEKEEEELVDSDSSHVIVNVTGPDDKHVEFLEPTIDRKEKDETPEDDTNVKEKEKKHEDGSWAKIGRRISLTVGLGRPRNPDKEKDKKDRERKSRSMDRSGLGAGIVEGVVASVSSMQKSISVGASSLAESSSRRASTELEMGAKGRVSSEGTLRPSAPQIATEPSTTSSASHSTNDATIRAKPLPPRPLVTESTPSSSSIALLRRSPSPQPATSTSVPQNPLAQSLIPNVQRSKSPKPPKPTAAETEYLRKILADVSPASSTPNPFAIFKPPLLHSHSHHHQHHTKPSLSTSSNTFTEPSTSDKSTMWLGMGRSFSGIEECLRMFTAVEILDGENMVGCRRCWKIQNGMYQPQKERRNGQDPEDSDQEDQEVDQEEFSSPGPSIEVQPATAHPTVNGFDVPPPVKPQRRPPLTVLAPSINTGGASVHLPTSISTPTVSFYSHTSSDTRSMSSLPTTPSDLSHGLSKSSSDTNSSEDNLSSINSERSTKASSDIITSSSHHHGIQIPIISTTAPDTPVESTSSLDSHYSTAESTSETNRQSAYAKLTENENSALSSSTSVPASSGPSPHPRLTQALYGYNSSSGSKDSLVIPHIGKSRPRYQRRKTYSETTTDNDSSGDETDTSIGTSVSADSLVSADSRGSNDDPQAPPAVPAAAEGTTSAPQVGASQSQQPTLGSSIAQPAPAKKPSKPKPVIMRPAYKRYLIATPPPVLVVHLKRFQQTSKTPLMMSFSHGFKKLDDYISFPEHLDLMPFLAPKKEDYGLGKKGKGKEKEKERKGKEKEERCMYRLYAVVVHIGNMLGGHYIAYTALPNEPPGRTTAARSSTSSSTANASSSRTSEPSAESEQAKPSSAPTVGESQEGTTTASSTRPSKTAERQWAYISDTVVRLTTLEEVLHAKAYICMYERC
ncbi:unnamed protein product [Cyclocybe aegerita]|uniref:ubiquitinyl hydrolase 1 n=1 Tax=Cyclocybe aegerita TaxID=1973307 RepID=A0A8S0WA72_CYCAE|nr:unnamed protein product [Cyclocybe aegerita]